MNTESDEAFWFRAEVFRIAHQVAASHGARGHIYAEKQEEDARANGDEKGAALWHGVKAALEPRGSMIPN